jgi:cell division initiation protein
MDSPENAYSALDAIDTVAFKVGLKGYNVDEVDEFLERLSSETRQLKDQLAQQRQQLRQAAERISQLDGGRPAPAPRPSSPGGAEQVTSMIAMAQQFIERAQQEAEEKARELTVAAQERAREIVGEARSRAEDEVNRLNGLKQRLSEDVEILSRQLELERTRLTGALGEFLRWVEGTMHVGGEAKASSSPASGPEAARHVAPDEPTQPHEAVGQVLNFEQPTRDDRS